MMEMTRRGFLIVTGAVGSGVALSTLGLNIDPVQAYAEELDKSRRLKAAKQVTTVCCYCSVGCGLICSVDKTTGKIFNIEGDPEHPINEGSLCAKGAGFFDLTEANKIPPSQGALPGPDERPMGGEELGVGLAKDRPPGEGYPRQGVRREERQGGGGQPRGNDRPSGQFQRG